MKNVVHNSDCLPAMRKMKDRPITVAYGAGTNSTAMLIGLYQKKIRPDLILFADTGAERPDTYKFINIFNKWLRGIDFPEINFVKDEKITLEQDCLNRKALPSLAYGKRSCSDHYKIRPQHRFIKQWQPAIDSWKDGNKVIKMIGYDAAEWTRMRDSDKGYENQYPLIEWDWTRKNCIEVIKNEGLDTPGKSSCFFCPSMRKAEILALKKIYPDLIKRVIKMENNAKLTTIKGLGRNYAWKDLVMADEQQVKLFEETDLPETICSCYDG